MDLASPAPNTARASVASGVSLRAMVLRCTQRLLKLIGLRPATLLDVAAGDDDWYANLLWFERRKCILVTHASTLFCVCIPDVRAPDLRSPGPLIVDAILAALDSENLPRDTLGDLDPRRVQLARTASRRVLGVMNDTALHIECALHQRGGLLDVDAVRLNRDLQRTLHTHQGTYAQPVDLARLRLT